MNRGARRPPPDLFTRHEIERAFPSMGQPAASDGRVEIQVHAHPDALSRLLARVREAARRLVLPGPVQDDLELLLDELCTNIVTHAGLAATDMIRITITRGRRLVAVEIRDRGIAFDPLAHPAPNLAAPLQERRIGGIGIHLLRHKTRRRCYLRRDPENLLRFAIRLDKKARDAQNPQ